MEFVSDFFARKFGTVADTGRVPEWAGIRLRLAAAQSARRELLAAEGDSMSRSGSFASGAAMALADLDRCKRVVNPDRLEAGKPDAARNDSSPIGEAKVAG